MPRRYSWRALREAEFRGAVDSLVVKAGLAPLVALAWLLAARIVISVLGVDGYAVYAIIAGLASLIPFADLGTGAAVMDAMARRGQSGSDPIDRVLLTTFRTLLIVTVILALLGLGFGAVGLWAPLLGLPGDASADQSMATALLIFALAFPFSVGPRLLTGGGLNSVAVSLQGLSAFLLIAIIGGLAVVTTAPEYFACAPFLAAGISNAVALFVASKRFDLGLAGIAGRIFQHSHPGIKVRGIAGPMFAISLILPLAYQMDRVVLSHVSSLDSVAQYSVAFQIFSPLLGIISTAGIALWPVFAHRRAANRQLSGWQFTEFQLAFAGIGIFFGVMLLTCGPYLSALVSDSRVIVPRGVFLAFGLLLALQAASYPMAMFLTSSSELSFQARLHIVMLAVNLPLSIWLADRYGAGGPVVASFAAIALTLFFPQWFRVRAVLRVGTSSGT